MTLELQRQLRVASLAFSDAADEASSSVESEATGSGSSQAGRVLQEGQKALAARRQMAVLLALTEWRILDQEPGYFGGTAGLVVRKGSLAYLLEFVWTRGQVDHAFIDALVQQYQAARSELKVNGLMILCPSAHVGERTRTEAMLRHRSLRLELLDSDNWLGELQRPAPASSSTTSSELILMTFIAAAGIVVIGVGFYLRFDYVVIGAGYLTYIFGVIGVTVSTIYKYRRL